MQLMPAIPAPVLVLTLLMGSAAAIANMIYFVMIGKINERMPENERISYLWWGSGVRKQFRQVYPHNRLVLVLDFSIVVGVICFALLVRLWVFG